VVFKVTIFTKEKKFFSREFFDYNDLHQEVYDNEFIKVDGYNVDDILLIPKNNIDFIRIEKFENEGQ
jgi:hypothetical protein